MNSLSIKSLAIIFGMTILLSVPLIINPSLHTRRDAVVHVAITNKILRSGIPPQNPFMAGEKLYYYWFYNALAAALTGISGIPPAMIMAALNVLAFFILLISVLGSVRSALPEGTNDTSPLLGILLVVFGLNGWGWFRLLGPSVKYGPNILTGILAGRVWKFLPLISPGGRGAGKLGFMASKFLVATSFSLALAAIGVSIYFLFKFFQKKKLLPAVLFCLSAALASYLHLVVGMMFIILCGVFGLTWLLLYRRGKRHGLKIAVSLLLLILVSLLLVAPYLTTVLGSRPTIKQGPVFSLPDSSYLKTYLFTLLPYLVILLLTFRSTIGRALIPSNMFLLLSVLLLAPAFLFLRIPGYNEFKFIFLSAVIMSLWGGISASYCRRWQRLIIWIIALSAAPTTLLGLAAYSFTPPSRAESRSPQQNAIFCWIAEHTPAETVVVDTRLADFIPMLARRDTYFGQKRFLMRRVGIYRPQAYQHRLSLMMDLLSGKDKTEILKMIRSEVQRPVILITHTGAMIENDGIKKLHSAGKIDIWALSNQY